MRARRPSFFLVQKSNALSAAQSCPISIDKMSAGDKCNSLFPDSVCAVVGLCGHFLQRLAIRHYGLYILITIQDNKDYTAKPPDRLEVYKGYQHCFENVHFRTLKFGDEPLHIANQRFHRDFADGTDFAQMPGNPCICSVTI